MLGAVIVKELDSKLVKKDGLCLFEAYSMLHFIRCSFTAIPFELDHTYIVCTNL